eukprot:CAMPEP_0194345162 /NCGR_PEP_ID=MMETSP0171-20130528/104637_1 /TAXON_ID=218684 /ORGANISM="Corethron pennatum, Strain L29A3" /LENGTH=71 /DNA_ID=CAMNT_0039112109 /DNA_START=395 /DNA_END=610 /DNA_ORIENTATION=-
MEEWHGMIKYVEKQFWAASAKSEIRAKTDMANEFKSLKEEMEGMIQGMMQENNVQLQKMEEMIRQAIKNDQ